MESLMQYLRKRRDGKQVKSGVLVARKIVSSKHKKVLVGWSKCKISGLRADKFDPKLGYDIANSRIETHLSEEREDRKVPPSIQAAVDEFVDRCKRYFKTDKVKVV